MSRFVSTVFAILLAAPAFAVTGNAPPAAMASMTGLSIWCDACSIMCSSEEIVAAGGSVWRLPPVARIRLDV